MSKTMACHDEWLSGPQRVTDWLNGLEGQEMYGMYRVVRVVQFQVLPRKVSKTKFVYDVVALVEVVEVIPRE